MPHRRFVYLLFYLFWLPLTYAQNNSNPGSEINVPLQVGLRPLFDWVERSVDTVFTSEGYPEDWVQKGCDLRYRYKFWRSRMQLKAVGQTLDLSFTGNYQMEGSTRACLSGVVVSPWTPSCSCGFTEGARKVEVRFINTLTILPAYQLQLKLLPQPPKPTDPCKVCFWEQDVTRQVMDGITEELNAAKQSLEKRYGKVDLKPTLGKVWSEMSRPVSLDGYGWLMIRPLGFRVNRLQANGDSLDLSIGLRARPVILNALPQAYITALPTDWEKPSTADEFNIRLDADLRYDSLSNLLNRSVLPMDIKPEKGPFRKNVRIDSISLLAGGEQRIRCLVFISGKYAGKLELSGIPVWDSIHGLLRLKEVELDVKTRHLVLGKAAKWFDKPIQNWLESRFSFDLASQLNEKRKWIEEKLNTAELGPLRCQGILNQLEWLGWESQPEGLRIRMGIQGKMACKIDATRLNL